MAFRSPMILCLSLLLAVQAVAHPGHDEQLAAVNEAMAAAPDEQSLYLQRGTIYAEIGHYPEALQDFNRARELGPEEMVDFAESVMHYRKGDRGTAARLVDKHISRFPNDPGGYEHRALIAREDGNHAQALADLRTYFTLRERPNPGLYVSAARMLHQDGRTGDAIAVLDLGLEQLGTIPQLQRYAIELELQQSQPEAAIRRMESLRGPLRDSTSWKLDMVDLLLAAGRKDEATTLLQAAREQLQDQHATPARKVLEDRAAALAAALLA
ncbi:MAG: tetratricopeptide repeat protein [Haliea sp.]